MFQAAINEGQRTTAPNYNPKTTKQQTKVHDTKNPNSPMSSNTKNPKSNTTCDRLNGASSPQLISDGPPLSTSSPAQATR
ncbi:hypothetical protein JTE90_019303 [Oedothorax gibbosus]|uniref:Uncharacterized protein n=1 Tax=Oedothorax gibbosus TaxID=931172 RepID=A0AAV6UX42_9ARAC|nr:hypothetical protein JTE90_019303 [Oedothorax gibbosus]